MLKDRRTVTILAIALCLIYIVVRVWRLTDSCLWFDEIFSVHAAEHTWNTIWWFVARDLIHPPLFYATLKLWIGIGGESLLWLRLLPVLFSALALVPFVYLCRELKLPDSVMLLSLAFLAVNGSLIKYTQTLRMYSMLMFLSLLSMWLFVRYFNRGKSFFWLLIANLLLVYTHYFGWLVVGTEVIAILTFQRIKWRRMVTMSVILLVGFLPWIIAVFKAARAGSEVGQNISWMSRPGIREMISFVFDLTEPMYFQASNGEPASLYRISVPILLIFLTAIIVYFINWKTDADKQRVYLVALFVFVPLVVAFILSWLAPYSVWGTRHLIVIYAPAAMLLAYFIVRISTNYVRIGAVTLLLLLSGYAVVLQAFRDSPRYVWCAWNGVVDKIRADEMSNEQPIKIYTFENLIAYHLWFALRDSDRYQVNVVTGVDVRTNDESYFLPRGFDQVPSVALNEIENNFWLAVRTSADGELAPILRTFEDRGYKQCKTDPIEDARYDVSTTVYLFKMTSGDCP